MATVGFVRRSCPANRTTEFQQIVNTTHRTTAPHKQLFRSKSTSMSSCCYGCGQDKEQIRKREVAASFSSEFFSSVSFVRFLFRLGKDKDIDMPCFRNERVRNFWCLLKLLVEGSECFLLRWLPWRNFRCGKLLVGTVGGP